MLLDNILANAVNYSKEGGRVEVLVRGASDGTATIGVTDHGIGIPADKLPRIFEEYYRTKEAVKHNPSSTGLGLAIVRDVARAEHIDIGVASAGLGYAVHSQLSRPSQCGGDTLADRRSWQWLSS